MANPISNFIYDCVIAPIEHERASTQPAAKDTTAFAYGAVPNQSHTLAQTLGQPTDTDYRLLGEYPKPSWRFRR